MTTDVLALVEAAADPASTISLEDRLEKEHKRFELHDAKEELEYVGEVRQRTTDTLVIRFTTANGEDLHSRVQIKASLTPQFSQSISVQPMPGGELHARMPTQIYPGDMAYLRITVDDGPERLAYQVIVPD